MRGSHIYLIPRRNYVSCLYTALQHRYSQCLLHVFIAKNATFNWKLFKLFKLITNTLYTYVIYTEHYPPRPRFCSVLLYVKPFSRYKVVDNQNCTEWLQNDLEQSSPDTLRGPHFGPFRSLRPADCEIQGCRNNFGGEPLYEYARIMARSESICSVLS